MHPTGVETSCPQWLHLNIACGFKIERPPRAITRHPREYRTKQPSVFTYFIAQLS